MPDSTGPVMRIAHLLLFATIVGAALAGCGQKGPLYLRENPPPNVKPVRGNEYKPVPYPSGLPADAESDGASAPK